MRRAQLGYKRQEDAATAAKVGVTTWRQIEGGKQDDYRPGTTTLVATLLGWPPDMLERIAAGEDPPAPDPDVVRRLDVVESRLDRIEAKVDRLVEQEEGPA